VVENLELRWTTPIAGFVKVNWDAYVDKFFIKMSIGVIIRDYVSEVMTTLSEPKYHIIAPDIGEATATLRVVFCFFVMN
jgi:hypothetical protein